MSSKPVQLLDRVVIRFAGDSGDRDENQARVIHLHDGEPVRVGADQVVARGDSGELTVVAAQGADPSRVVTHHAGAWEILAHRILRTLLFCAAVLAARREFAWCRSVFDNEDVPSPVELRWRPVDRQATLTKSSSLLLNQGTTTEMEPA
jgi:hypothetical protein